MSQYKCPDPKKCNNNKHSWHRTSQNCKANRGRKTMKKSPALDPTYDPTAGSLNPKVTYGFVPPEDVLGSLTNSSLLETKRVNEYSEYWLKDNNGNVVGFAKVNTQEGIICDIQSRVERKGYGSFMVNALREELGIELKSTGMATEAGKNLLQQTNVPIDEKENYGNYHVIKPMRFVQHWDAMAPKHSLYGEDSRDSNEIPASFGHDVNGEFRDKVFYDSQLIPASHLSRQDDVIIVKRKKYQVQDVKHNEDGTVTVMYGDWQSPEELVSPAEKGVRITGTSH